MTKRVEATPGKSLVEMVANAPGMISAADVEARALAIEHQFRHDNTITPLAPKTNEEVRIVAMTGAGSPLDRAAVYFSTDGSQPDLSAPSVPMGIDSVRWDNRTGYVTSWVADIPGQAAGTVVRYRIGGWKSAASPGPTPDVWAHDGSGFWFRFPGESGITTFAYHVGAHAADLPPWTDETVIYQIFLDRFHSGSADGRFLSSREKGERHGGTLAGVGRALPYLAELGVNCLWLTPLHPSDTYHRYDTKDYFGIDRQLGDEQDLRSLVEDAHRLGIRVLLDFVPSHSSWKHPAFLAAQSDPSAPSASWYTFDRRPDRYRCFLQTSTHLPSIDTRDPGARKHLTDAAMYWLTEFGIDGFRLDHTIGAGMDFWVAFQMEVQRAKPDAITIAEATDTPDCLRRYRGKLSSILDFELAAMLRLTFAQDAFDVLALDSFIRSYERFMADGPARVSFLDNHDMDRFLCLAGNDVRRLELAALCLFTLPPTPAVYYGTEIGMSQASTTAKAFGGDEEARKDMVWDRDAWNHDLLDFYRSLIRLRKTEEVLARGTRRTVHVDPAGTWAYLRSMNDSELPTTGDLLIAFNLGERPATLRIPGMTSAEHALVEVGDRTEITGEGLQLGSRSAAVFRIL